MKKYLALALLSMSPTALAAGPYSATLEWDTPRQYEDGSALPASEILTYTVHYGKASGNYESSVTVSPTATETTISGLTPGTWYFALTVTSTELEVSDFSAEVSAKMTAGKIKKPVLRFVRRSRD